MSTPNIQIFIVLGGMMKPPDVKTFVVPGGMKPERASEEAAGFDVRIRALVERDEMDQENQILRKTVFDFKNIPVDQNVMSHAKLRPTADGTGEELVYVLQPRESVIAGAGFIMEMPFPLCYIVFNRTGFMTREEVSVENAPSIVDPDYRGEIGMRIENIGREPFILRHNMRIAQIKFDWAVIPNLITVERYEDLSITKRGTSAYGSTGIH